MTNGTCLLIYIALLFVTLVLAVDTARKDPDDFTARQFLNFSLNLIGWIVCEMLYFSLESESILRYIFDLKLVFVSQSAIAMFFTIGGYYRLERVTPIWLHIAAYSIPTVTAIMAMLSPWHELLLASYEIIQFEPMLLATSQPGPWFYAHTFYCQGLVVGMAILLVKEFRTLPQTHRGGSLLLFLGLGTYLVFTAADGFGMERHTIDYSLIGACMSGVMFYLASLVGGRYSYMHMERQEVFHYMDEAIIILDRKGRVVETNKAAKNLFELLGLQPDNLEATGILDKLAAEGKIVRKPSKGQGQEDCYIQVGQFPLVYELYRRTIVREQTGETGTFVVLTDVTTNRLTMERLRDVAGVDPLTGLANRYRHLERLRELDSEEFLPLSVIVGDVNGLKEINDTHGHTEGDALLRSVGATLLRCAPPGSHVARMGGDEFAILIPRCEAAQAKQAALFLQQQVGAVQVAGITASIALGCATKTSPEENLNRLLHHADMDMYSDKRSREPGGKHTPPQPRMIGNSHSSA